MPPSKSNRLRAAMRDQEMVVAPGAYDCITARLVEQAGFSAVYMTGAGTAASLGYPDYGLVTMTEMVANAGRIAAAVDAPVIADADTGYGNELNVVRTVREYERAGVAAIHLEDQAFPKRCGHLDNKEIVAREEWLAKIRAASDAKTDPEFLIIARTDARAVAGYDEAVARCKAALEAGADVAFLEAPQSMDEVRQTPQLVGGPCLLNIVHGGKTPDVDMKVARELGYRLTIIPGLLLVNVIAACDSALEEFRRIDAHPMPPKDMSVREMFSRVGANEWDPLREKFRKTAPNEAAE